MARDKPHPTLLEEMFEEFPRGIALLELVDPANTDSWRLAAINNLASNLVSPSIYTFLSAEQLHLGEPVDLRDIYREIIAKRRPKVIGMVEKRGSHPPARLYTMSAFPAGMRGVAILFEDVRSLMSGRDARVRAESQLAQTCEFVGAILWRADPETLQFHYVSPHAQTILGYWVEPWASETNFWKKHLLPEDREHVVQVCEKILRERRRHDFAFRMISAHGQVLWFHAAAELIETYGQRPELVGVMNDITDLKRAEERIRALTSRLMRLQDDERRHISRELHDSLGQYLTSVKINLELVKRESTSLDAQHRALLAESSETLERCVQEVRSVSYLLHPPLLDELGLLAALRWFTAGFGEHSGIEVNFKAPQQFSRLPEEMELAIFRIVQESLNNIQRHSRSDSAWVTLSENQDNAEIRITDSGVGIPTEVIERIKEGKTLEGVGVRGMYERARDLGGRLEIQSSAMGTAISAVFPLQSPPGKRVETGGARSLRTAGKALQTTDVHIETAGGGDGAGEVRKAKEGAFRSAETKRRASRRSK